MILQGVFYENAFDLPPERFIADSRNLRLACPFDFYT
jgi:hypothetical protein